MGASMSDTFKEKYSISGSKKNDKLSECGPQCEPDRKQ